MSQKPPIQSEQPNSESSEEKGNSSAPPAKTPLESMVEQLIATSSRPDFVIEDRTEEMLGKGFTVMVPNDSAGSSSTTRTNLAPLLAKRLAASGLPPPPEPENFETEEEYLDAKSSWDHRVLPLLRLRRPS